MSATLSAAMGEEKFLIWALRSLSRSWSGWRSSAVNRFSMLLVNCFHGFPALIPRPLLPNAALGEGEKTAFEVPLLAAKRRLGDDLG